MIRFDCECTCALIGLITHIHGDYNTCVLFRNGEKSWNCTDGWVYSWVYEKKDNFNLETILIKL